MLPDQLGPLSGPHDDDPAFPLHKGGKIEVRPTVRVRDRAGLSLAYTPGVARVSQALAADPSLAYDYTWKSNTVLVVTDGTAVLGLGDIGPRAALPVMEGKALLFKEFGGVDAVPVCLDTTDTQEIIDTVVRIAPAFGGVNLEDISAPRCFEVERGLQDRLDIPVFHDDQHGTAIVVIAALESALRLTGRTFAGLKVVVSGAGAAGVAVSNMLLAAGVRDLCVVDSQGLIGPGREGLSAVKADLAGRTNPRALSGPIDAGLEEADVFIGVSAGRVPESAVAGMATTRSSSPWPTPTPRWTQRWPASTPRWWPPAAATTRTRSTTCSPSPGSSVGRWTCGPRGSRRGCRWPRPTRSVSWSAPTSPRSTSCLRSSTSGSGRTWPMPCPGLPGPMGWRGCRRGSAGRGPCSVLRC